jgi:hypothetical protein
MDRDDLDGICGFSREQRLDPVDSDEERIALVLFSDIDWTNSVEVTKRKTEWYDLFGDRNA